MNTVTATPATIPAPPEFPASNASYNKIVGKMHQAALAASTSAAAIAAVTLIRDAVKGVNTYSKKCRRYGDELITALGGEAPAATAPKTAGKAPQAAKKAKAAPKAQPAAEAPETAAQAVDAAELPAQPAAAFTPRTFSNKSNAKRALKKEQLDHLPVSFMTQDGDTVLPVVSVTDEAGVAYANDRGFAAKVVG
jgi:hypothetical protein